MRIESLLSARLFITPQLVGDRLYFVSNQSGRLSLYVMRAQPGGSVPQPLLPPDLALQNPHLMDGYAFYVFPTLRKILVMLDRDGDENYQPMLLPIDGGYPEPAFGAQLANYRVHCARVDADRNLIYLNGESRTERNIVAFRGDLATGTLLKLGESTWGSFVAGVNDNHTQAILTDSYTTGDEVLYLWQQNTGQRRLLYGKPLDTRAPGENVPLNAIGECHFVARDAGPAQSGAGILFTTARFDDTFGLGYLDLNSPDAIQRVPITGIAHNGVGELVGCRHLQKNRYALEYNIDGCSWLYPATFDARSRTMKLGAPLCGAGTLSNGVLDSFHYDKKSDAFALSFSTATSPTQIYTIRKKKVTRHTGERVLGLPDAWFSPGEDAAFVSHDGQRVSARLYLPAPALTFKGPRPVVYYVHGGPQSQERPNFAWFSMPLIQFLTMNGFAVFVPNARGSTGYGLSYTKKVDRDWGGADRLDHVHAMTKVLPRDKRLDVSRAAVVGRSYGGYMTLMLAARHPELWRAAVDMFGPYDLTTFSERIPVTWKPYFELSIGHPVKDREFLLERSPRRYVENIRCPLLVIQGANDPRVIERESRDVVEQLRAAGKTAEYLVFDNEGHDVLKFDNRVRCYNAITDFFRKYLRP
jgi:pimeloyl-ACP methyl ester carboxylesterase